MRYKLTIEYDGGPYHGWQRLPDAPTVQAALEDAAEKLTGVRTEVIGAGRTDSGVHAYAQVAHVDIEKPLQAWQIVEALNSHLHFPVSEGVLITDFWTAYDSIANGKRQFCLAHLLRELEKVDDFFQENQISFSSHSSPAPPRGFLAGDLRVADRADI